MTAKLRALLGLALLIVIGAGATLTFVLLNRR